MTVHESSTIRTYPTRRPPRAVMVIAVATAVGFSAACGDSGDDAATTVRPTPTTTIETPSDTGTTDVATAEATITIDDFSFGDPITVTPGQVVTVTNRDSTAHTVTANDDTFDVAVDAGVTVTFAAPIDPGTYDFHCTYHSGMQGTLNVE